MDLEGNSNHLQCRMGAIWEEKGVFSGSCLFKRILFLLAENVGVSRKLFNFGSLYIDELLQGSQTVKGTVFVPLW